MTISLCSVCKCFATRSFAGQGRRSLAVIESRALTPCEVMHVVVCCQVCRPPKRQWQRISRICSDSWKQALFSHSKKRRNMPYSIAGCLVLVAGLAYYYGTPGLLALRHSPALHLQLRSEIRLSLVLQNKVFHTLPYSQTQRYNVQQPALSCASELKYSVSPA